MEIKLFQIIVPLLALFIIGRQIWIFKKASSTIYETILIIIFWVCVIIFALFPDLISNLIAKIFGIKNNVNAILFFAIGLLFYFQLQLYKMTRKLDEKLTEICRKVALKNPKGE